MNNPIVLDTVALVLLLEKRRMPSAAKKIVEQTLERGGTVLIPAMVLLEVAYLSEKGRISCSLIDAHKFLDGHQNISVADISSDIVARAFSIDDIPELHDRVIAGTALHFGAILLTSDAVIRASKCVDAVWE